MKCGERERKEGRVLHCWGSRGGGGLGKFVDLCAGEAKELRS